MGVCRIKILLPLMMLLSLLLPETGYADNASLIRELNQVIDSDPRLEGQADEWKRIVTDVFDDFEGSVGDDRLKHGASHLKDYLDDILKHAEGSSPLQREVARKTFQWALGNYISVPGIDDKTRKRALDNLDGMRSGIRTFIDSSFQDTPQNIKDAIWNEVERQLFGPRHKIGNYFYTQYLYASEQKIDADEVVQSLSRRPFMDINATRYASIKSILEDESLDLKSRQTHVQFYVRDQARLVKSSVDSVYRGAFRSPPKGTSVPPPEELVKLGARLHAELVTKAEEDNDNFVQKVEHNRLMQELNVNSELKPADGALAPDLEKLSVSPGHDKEASVQQDVKTSLNEPSGSLSASGSNDSRFNIIVFISVGVTAILGLLVYWRIKASRNIS